MYTLGQSLIILVSVFYLLITSSLSSRLVRSPADESLETSSITTTISSTNGILECGNRKRTPNVIPEDQYAEFGEFPWIIAILQTSKTAQNGEYGLGFICSGSLLSATVVLTAAHCVHNVDPASLRIRAGVYNINNNGNDNIPHQERTVKQITIHGNFSHKALYNDMALLSIGEPFQYNNHISPICAPLEKTIYKSPDSFDPQRCLVTGWGKNDIAENGTVPEKLKKVNVEIMPMAQCETILKSTRLTRKFSLHSSFICAKENDPFNNVCQGDGGAPLICASKSNPNTYVQVGVTSWGIGCENTIPGIYAALQTNAEWLNTEFNNFSRSTVV